MHIFRKYDWLTNNHKLRNRNEIRAIQVNICVRNVHYNTMESPACQPYSIFLLFCRTCSILENNSAEFCSFGSLRILEVRNARPWGDPWASNESGQNKSQDRLRDLRASHTCNVCEAFSRSQITRCHRERDVMPPYSNMKIIKKLSRGKELNNFYFRSHSAKI